MIAPIRRSAAFRGVRSLVHEAARTLDLTSRADMAGVDLDVEYTKLHFADQTVHAGTHAMPGFLGELGEMKLSKPLIVTDQGIAGLGILQQTVKALESAGMAPAVFDKCEPNPGITDIIGIAKAFLDNKCDSIIGFGGGGPLDAAKGGATLVAHKKLNSGFHLENEEDTCEFMDSEARRFVAYVNDNLSDMQKVTPPIIAIPTTSGTGSDGGKSAVICDRNGVKVVFGHPILMPKAVALLPNLTVGMPARLTAATGIDAMFHCLEAYMVPTVTMMERDGMSEAEIAYCDAFAIAGIRHVCRSLPTAVSIPTDLSARLNMQIAALYGAKAFRKGDLGGVHASAHALGAHYHWHHGECIARMAVPVLSYSEEQPGFANAAKIRAESLADLICVNSETNDRKERLSMCVEDLLSQFCDDGLLTMGVPETKGDAQLLETLSKAAAADGCQTNPVPLSQEDYFSIFTRASSM
ncbi:hypothetical protein AAMO2058_000954800 [Amorphochlora amoebiformis]